MLPRKCLFLINALSNYILHETFTYYNKDPPWFHSQIKSLLQDKKSFTKTVEGVTLLLRNLKN